VSKDLLLRKGCDCKGSTSSGPRIITTPVREGEAWRLESETVRLACDRCNEPWEVGPSGGGETA
jgi:hypothetical protein